MIDKINALEEKAAVLSPDKETRQALRAKAIDLAEEFLEDLPHSKIYNLDETGKKLYDTPLVEPDSWDNMLDVIKNEIDLPGINAASGRHLGYIPGGGLYASSLGDYLAAVYNKYAGVYFAAPGAVRMENQLINWMGELIGYKEGFAGNLTSGGSIANLTAIVAARDAFNIKGRDVEKTVIYASEQMHHCVNKAIRIAGMNEAIIRYLPLDEKHRIVASTLEEHVANDREQNLRPWMVIASAGTTDTGAIDPLEEIGVIARRNNLWFHVDAAYGGFFMLCDEFKDKLKGLEMTDSLVMDPHKGLFLPYGIGTVLVKDGQKLYEAHSQHANYMQDTIRATDEISPADLSPELSKHFRGLRMWIPIKLYGLEPFKACLEEKIWLTRYFYEQLGQLPGFELGPYPDLTVMYFRYLPKFGDANEFNEQLARSIQEDGRTFLSTTVLGDTFVIRLAVLSFRSHLREIDLTLEIIKEKLEELEGKSNR